MRTLTSCFGRYFLKCSQLRRWTSPAHMRRMTWSHILSMLGRGFTSRKLEAAFQANGDLRQHSLPYLRWSTSAVICNGMTFGKTSAAILANKPNLAIYDRDFQLLMPPLRGVRLWSSWTKSALSNTWGLHKSFLHCTYFKPDHKPRDGLCGTHFRIFSEGPKWW